MLGYPNCGDKRLITLLEFAETIRQLSMSLNDEMIYEINHRQLSFALLKPLYSNWHLISIGPQVVCKVSNGKTRERSFHLMPKKKKSYLLQKGSPSPPMVIDRSYPGSLF